MRYKRKCLFLTSAASSVNRPKDNNMLWIIVKPWISSCMVGLIGGIRTDRHIISLPHGIFIELLAVYPMMACDGFRYKWKEIKIYFCYIDTLICATEFFKMLTNNATPNILLSRRGFYVSPYTYFGSHLLLLLQNKPRNVLNLNIY